MALKQKVNSEFVPAKRNPFAVDHVTRIPYRFEDGNWSSNLKRLQELNYRAAIIGPQGSGKTTLLGELEEHLIDEVERETVSVFVPRDKDEQTEMLNSVLSENLDRKILLVDGIERISLLQRMSLVRASNKLAGLVVASHRPLRLPPYLPMWIKTQSSELVLDYVLSELSMDSPEIREAGQLSFQKRRGNIREVLRDLYDRHAANRFR